MQKQLASDFDNASDRIDTFAKEALKNPDLPQEVRQQIQNSLAGKMAVLGGGFDPMQRQQYMRQHNARLGGLLSEIPAPAPQPKLQAPRSVDDALLADPKALDDDVRNILNTLTDGGSRAATDAEVDKAVAMARRLWERKRGLGTPAAPDAPAAGPQPGAPAGAAPAPGAGAAVNRGGLTPASIQPLGLAVPREPARPTGQFDPRGYAIMSDGSLADPNDRYAMSGRGQDSLNRLYHPNGTLKEPVSGMVDLESTYQGQQASMPQQMPQAVLGQIAPVAYQGQQNQQPPVQARQQAPIDFGSVAPDGTFTKNPQAGGDPWVGVPDEFRKRYEYNRARGEKFASSMTPEQAAEVYHRDYAPSKRGLEPLNPTPSTGVAPAPGSSADFRNKFAGADTRMVPGGSVTRSDKAEYEDALGGLSTSMLPGGKPRGFIPPASNPIRDAESMANGPLTALNPATGKRVELPALEPGRFAELQKQFGQDAEALKAAVEQARKQLGFTGATINEDEVDYRNKKADSAAASADRTNQFLQNQQKNPGLKYRQSSTGFGTGEQAAQAASDFNNMAAAEQAKKDAYKAEQDALMAKHQQNRATNNAKDATTYGVKDGEQMGNTKWDLNKLTAEFSVFQKANPTSSRMKFVDFVQAKINNGEIPYSDDMLKVISKNYGVQFKAPQPSVAGASPVDDQYKTGAATRDQWRDSRQAAREEKKQGRKYGPQQPQAGGQQQGTGGVLPPTAVGSQLPGQPTLPGQPPAGQPKPAPLPTAPKFDWNSRIKSAKDKKEQAFLGQLRSLYGMEADPDNRNAIAIIGHPSSSAEERAAAYRLLKSKGIDVASIAREPLQDHYPDPNYADSTFL